MVTYALATPAKERSLGGLLVAGAIGAVTGAVGAGIGMAAAPVVGAAARAAGAAIAKTVVGTAARRAVGAAATGIGMVARQVVSPREGGLIAAEGGGRLINPNLVRFSQDSISANFSDGSSVAGMADRLAAGERINVPPIRLVNHPDGGLFTLDNRRLVAFQQAGVPIPYRMATADEFANESWKFTTVTLGRSIQLRFPGFQGMFPG
jgi:hypothetical protein